MTDSKLRDALLAVMNDGMLPAVVRFTPDLVVTFSNPSFAAACPAGGPEVVGSRLADVLSPALVDGFRAAIAGLTVEAPRSVIEREGPHADERPRWQRWQIAASFDQAGRITEIEAAGSAATGRVLCEAALEGLLSILETMPARVISVDGGGAGAIANAAARADPRPDESRALDQTVLASGRAVHDHLERWEDGGRVRWMRTDRIPYDDPATGARRLLVVADDVTGAVARERALAESNEALGQFASLAAHDLQEPLRKIATFVDVMMEGLAADDRDGVGYAAGVIRDAARRASRLVRDLLAWSRVGDGPLERQPVAAAAVVRGVVADVLAARPGAVVEIADEMAEAMVSADPGQFRLLVENLLVNAVKYRHADRTPRLVLRLGADPGGRTVFEVEDNGIGFDPADARRIFEPFRRLHDQSEYPGTGVGLAVVARVCERHGWTVEAVGRPGSGALFRVGMGLPPAAGAA